MPPLQLVMGAAEAVGVPAAQSSDDPEWVKPPFMVSKSKDTTGVGEPPSGQVAGAGWQICSAQELRVPPFPAAPSKMVSFQVPPAG